MEVDLCQAIDFKTLFNFDQGRSPIRKIYENIVAEWDSSISYRTVRDALLGRTDPKKNAREAISKSVGLPESRIFNANKAPYDAILDAFCYQRLHGNRE